jgi:enoyl-CoA hydratase/carnithine racemase
MGMLSEVVPLAELEARAQAVAEEIAGNAPLSLEGIKQTLSRCFAHEREIDYGDLRECMAKCLASDDVMEGVSAFMQRRKPDFKGK